MARLEVPAVVQPQTEYDATASTVTIFRGLIEMLGIIPGKSQMPQGTALPGSDPMGPRS